MTYFKKLIIAVFVLLGSLIPTYGVEELKDSSSNPASENKEYIKHHLLDSYSFHILTSKNHEIHWDLPLPVILYDNGLQVFMSSKFSHQPNGVAESNGNYYKINHGHIYKCDSVGNLEMNAEGHAHGRVWLDFSVTKNVVFIVIVSLIMIFIFTRIAGTYKNSLIPRKGGKFFEPIILFVKDEIAIPNIGEKHYRKYMGFLLTVFFFIWIINLFGMTPLGVNVTGNIAVTFALAIITFVITQFTAKGTYWKHIFWMPGVPLPMKIILAPIELLGVFIKPFALMIRLYANMTAGHVVLMSLIALLWVFQSWAAQGAFVGLTLFLSLIELLVAFLQAYIFTMLSALYFGFAVEEHAEHEHHH